MRIVVNVVEKDSSFLVVYVIACVCMCPFSHYFIWILRETKEKKKFVFSFAYYRRRQDLHQFH